LTVMIPMIILFELALFATRFLVPKPAPVAK
jgi:Sec-independent protein secretion pathway component TatC